MSVIIVLAGLLWLILARKSLPTWYLRGGWLVIGLLILSMATWMTIDHDDIETVFLPFAMMLGSLWVWFAAPLLIYRNARSRFLTPRQSLAWSLLGVGFWVIGFLLYLLANPKGADSCPGCGRETQPAFRQCPYCHTPLILFCRQCGREIQRDWNSCAYCGTRFSQEHQDPAKESA